VIDGREELQICESRVENRGTVLTKQGDDEMRQSRGAERKRTRWMD